jgi:rhodanese-related sulfurtransferase
MTVTGNLRISVPALRAAMAGPARPLVIDVRRPTAFLESAHMVRGALRRVPDTVDEWGRSLPSSNPVVVYCVHGREVSQAVAAALAGRGLAAFCLEGGIEAWLTAGGAADSQPRHAPTRWVTRERPKIDRIACPWLVARFVDQDAEFLYAPTDEVRGVALAKDAVAFDIPDVHFPHVDERCSFDAFVQHYGLADPALAELARIVRGADTASFDLAPQAAGLAAISLGLSRNYPDDHAMLQQGIVMYDALYSWCRNGKDEVHTWNLKPIPTLAC